jgi:hypothetical protein
MTKQSLAQEWIRRLASRGAVVAGLLAVPVLVVALIGLGGGTPLSGLSSVFGGPSEEAAGAGLGGAGGAVATNAGTVAAAPLAPAAAPGVSLVGGAGGAGGGPGQGPGGRGPTGLAPVPGPAPGPSPGQPAPPGPPQGGGSPTPAPRPGIGESLGQATEPLTSEVPDPVGGGLQESVEGIGQTVDDLLRPR